MTGMAKDPATQSPDIDKPSLLHSSDRFASLNIVICDPDHNVAVLVRNILATLGFNRMFIVHDGDEVLELMREEKLDFVVTDWDMERFSGIDLIYHLRKSLESPNRMIPIIMLTARNARKDIQSARDAGITEYIIKPFTAKTLLERIYEIVKEPRGFIICKSYIGPDRRRVSSMELPPDPDEHHNFQERKPALIVDKEVLQQVLMDDTPRMIMPDYSIKKKVGYEVPDILLINPLALANSEQEIKNVQDEFMVMMLQDVETLQKSFSALTASTDNAKQLLSAIQDASFSIKSRAGIFGYVRATEVAGQLHNFCRRYYDKDNPDHLVILEKHIQTIAAIFNQKITGDGGEVGRALIIDLARLINKYMKKPA